jgi:hypothetical protein
MLLSKLLLGAEQRDSVFVRDLESVMRYGA